MDLAITAHVQGNLAVATAALREAQGLFTTFEVLQHVLQVEQLPRNLAVALWSRLAATRRSAGPLTTTTTTLLDLRPALSAPDVCISALAPPLLFLLAVCRRTAPPTP